MDKLRLLVDLLSENKLNDFNNLLEEVLKEKILLKLEERKSELDLFSEGEIKVNNKKKKNKMEVRVGRKFDGISAKHTGRTLFRTLDSNKLKSILATENSNISDMEEQIDPEQVIKRVQRRKWHNLSMHSHQARDKNLSDRQGLENKLNTLAKQKFKRSI